MPEVEHPWCKLDIHPQQGTGIEGVFEFSVQRWCHDFHIPYGIAVQGLQRMDQYRFAGQWQQRVWCAIG